MEKLKVFLSSAMTELHNERVAVHNALTERGIEVIWFEGFGARPETAQIAYLEGVQEADVYIGIFWNQYSPATEEEYRKAEQLGRSCFIYCKDFAISREPKLQALVDELGRKHIYKTFGDALTLAEQVQTDIQDWIVHQWRQTKKQLFLTEERLKKYRAEEEQAQVLLRTVLAHDIGHLLSVRTLPRAELQDQLSSLETEIHKLNIASDEPLPAEVLLEPVDYLVDEVKSWLEVMGYTVWSQVPVKQYRVDLVAQIRIGPLLQRVLVECVDGEIEPRHIQQTLAYKQISDIREAWLISRRAIPRQTQELADRDVSIQVFTLDSFIGRLVNFDRYIEGLEMLVEEESISDFYVDLACIKTFYDWEGHELGRERYDPIDSYIDEWLRTEGKNHISILGEFGSGKTWFCRYYAYRQLQRYLADPTRERLPILINLRDYAKSVSVQQLITDLLINRYGVKLTGGYAAFEQLNRSGRLLIIFDGFDEMAHKVDYQTMVDNFWELAQVVAEGSKVLLTSRTEYFRWAKESEKVLGGEELGRKMIVIEPPKFEVLYLEPFSDEQIEEVIVKRVGSENGPAVAQRIFDTRNLAALARKPVLIELLLTALPAIEIRGKVNEAQVYLYATNELLLRNITAERTFTTTADKLFFLCELAWEMIHSGELRIHYTDIPQRIKTWLGDRIKDWPELDHWDYDLRNQTFLQRNAAGYYEFTHKSLAEYFVAYKFAAELGCLSPEFTQTYCEADGKPCSLPIAQKDVTELAGTFGAFPLAGKQMLAVMSLLPEMVGDVARLWAVIENTEGYDFATVQYVGGNAATLLVGMGSSFIGRNLSGKVLTGADLRGVDILAVGLGHEPLNNVQVDLWMVYEHAKFTQFRETESGGRRIDNLIFDQIRAARDEIGVPRESTAVFAGVLEHGLAAISWRFLFERLSPARLLDALADIDGIIGVGFGRKPTGEFEQLLDWEALWEKLPGYFAL
jgi:hypothetical protein